MNSLIFYEDRVVKTFGSRKRFETELKMRDLFSETFCIPRILDIDDAQNTVHFERIYTLPPEEIMKRMNLEEIISLFNRLPKLKGRRVRNDQKKYILSKGIDPFTAGFINEISLEGNDLIHGDFRSHNILQTMDRLYLIDFELSEYGDREKDIAYFYVATLYFNPKIGNDFLEHMRKQPNYTKFLFYCLYYSFTATENPLSNREGLACLRKEVCEEINNL